eukprot:TRINITY_DN14076_c0_g1_i1.p3 TRINITY_DN14076_c0_g1~~TRINITY_DN14076_c0_g1_i1.p3  ORF type:complete len:112 (-),score=22.65 TRINITY_DN14076_c0_g1_i1:30-365(-)
MQQGSKGRSGRSRSLRSQGSAPKLQELQTLRLSGGLCRGRHVKSPGAFIRPKMYQATEDNNVMKMDMGDLGAGGHLLGLRRRVFGRTILAVYVSQPSGKELGIRPKPKEWS